MYSTIVTSYLCWKKFSYILYTSKIMYHLYTYLLGIHKCLWAEIFVVNCCRLQHLCIFCFSWSIQNQCKQIIVQCHFIKFRICMTRKDWSFFIYCRLEKNSTFFQHRKFLNTKSLVWGISPSAFLFKTFIVQKSRARFGVYCP